MLLSKAIKSKKSPLMNKLKYLVIIVILFFGWQTISAQDAPSEKGKKATLHSKSIVDWYTFSGNYSVKIKKGDGVAFEVTSATGIDERNDSKIISTLLFSVDPDIESFKFGSEDFEQINAFLKRQCRCLDAGHNKLKSGIIEGKRIEKGLWELNIDVIAIGNNLKNEYAFSYQGIAKK